jgi:DNA-binding NtrC family response regulator
MGLSVIHGIIRGCGGMIKVESEIGQGSTFKVYLPVSDKRTEEQEDRPDTTLPTGSEHILVVDDEETIINFQKAALEHLGYTVTATTSSLHAFNKFEANPDKYDLIITDQTMPHLPGSELAKEVFKIKSDFPIILCTGYSSLVSEKAALKMGIKEFLLKPVDWEKLAQVVRTVLDRQTSVTLTE